MTRKRFKKILMSEGFSRNHAEQYAREVAQMGISFDSAIADYYVATKIPVVMEHVINAAAQMTYSLKVSLDELARTVKTLREAPFI